MAATFAFGSSPSTSPPLFSRRDTITSRCSVNPQEKDARVPRLLKFAVGGATEFLRLLSPSNKNKRNDWTSEEVCVVRSVDEVVEMLRLDYNKAYFLTGKFTPGLYAEDCLFEDPTIKFRGKDRYSQNLDLLVPFLDQPSLTLEKIEKEMDYNMDSIIIAEWKLRTYLKFPWRPLISINGSTIYRLDKDFKIIMHSESWSVSALEAVGQLFSSGIKNNASASPLFREFWFRKAFHVLNVTRLNTTISFDCSKLVVSKTCRTLIIKDIIPARASMKGKKKSMNQEKDEYPEFVEVDPTGRYGRYSEILGKGSSKIVYRAFDEYEGIEVAWNQVKLYDFLQSPEDLERLYCEIHLLKTLKHKNIMKFYTSWVDTSKRNINFVTELFTSGTLRQYRQRHKRVSIRALKHWCRQILKGLLYLHSHDPPVIHRDLKCDNIFINGNQGEVKIGDLGLAAILRKSHAAHCVGTPEFMAPEVYEEEYNELVDIYSFGMCVLEMVTLEYPYSECTHPAQIYKKVVSGTKPESLYKIKDPEVRKFVEKCLVTASMRLPARELLKDPFLQLDDHAPVRNEEEIYDIGSIFRQPSLNQLSTNGVSNGYMNDYDNQREVISGWDYDVADISTHGMDLFNNHEDEHKQNVDITIKGRRKEDGGIFLRLRIADKDGRVRNIYFPFDIETDTALSVATEMVAELDITDYEVTRISEMIDDEVSSLVPEWEPGPGISETPRHHPYTGLCNHCVSHVSSSSLLDYLSKSQSLNSHSQSPSSHCFNCMAVHGRFEQNITYHEEQNVMDGAPGLSTSQSDEDFETDDKLKQINNARRTRMGKSMGDLNISFDVPEYYWMNLSDESENEIRQELRWLKAKHQNEQREYKESTRVLHPSPDHQSSSMDDTYFQIMDNLEGLDVFAGNVFYNDGLVPNGLARTKSLPVDAAEV